MTPLTQGEKEERQRNLRALCNDEGIFAALGVDSVINASVDDACNIVASVLGIGDGQVPSLELVIMLRRVLADTCTYTHLWDVSCFGAEEGILGEFCYRSDNPWESNVRHRLTVVSYDDFRIEADKFLGNLGIDSIVAAYNAGVPRKDILI